MDPTGEWEGEVPILRENSFLDDANDDMSLLGQNAVMQPAITSPAPPPALYVPDPSIHHFREAGMQQQPALLSSAVITPPTLIPLASPPFTSTRPVGVLQTSPLEERITVVRAESSVILEIPGIASTALVPQSSLPPPPPHQLPSAQTQQQQQQQQQTANPVKKKEETPKEIVRRPVRQSRLKRKFNVADLDKDDDDGGGDAFEGGETEMKTKKNSKGPRKLGGGHPAAAQQQHHHQQQYQQNSAPLPPSTNGVYSQQRWNIPLPLSTASILTHPAPPFPCPLDLHCPRRQRSFRKIRKRTSRASLSRLKQAAHGNLPLGGSASQSAVRALLQEEEGDGGSGDESGISYSQQREGGGKRQQQQQQQQYSSTAAASGNRAASGQNISMQLPPAPLPATLPAPPANPYSSLRPSPEQLERMHQIASAPPHLRQAMLHQLLKQNLVFTAQSPFANSAAGVGVAAAAPPPPPLMMSKLPREEQNAVVEQLMRRMTPQQRHSMLQFPPQQQAEMLQQLYSTFIVPEQQARQQQHHQQQQMQQQHQQQMPQREQMQQQQQQQPFMNATASTTAPMMMQRPPQPPPPSSSLQSFINSLGPSVQAQMSTMPHEQQQAFIQRLSQHHRSLLQQQQQQQQQQMQQHQQQQQQFLPQNQDAHLWGDAQVQELGGDTSNTNHLMGNQSATPLSDIPLIQPRGSGTLMLPTGMDQTGGIQMDPVAPLPLPVVAPVAVGEPLLVQNHPSLAGGGGGAAGAAVGGGVVVAVEDEIDPLSLDFLVPRGGVNDDFEDALNFFL